MPLLRCLQFSLLFPPRQGVLSVNGHVVGRFFPEAGPQVSLYVPASALLAGQNVVQLLELDHLDDSCHGGDANCFITLQDSMVWLS